MRKRTKALSGASQDAYFRRVLKAHPELSADEREALVHRLRQEVAQLRVRVDARRDGGTARAASAEPIAVVAQSPRTGPPQKTGRRPAAATTERPAAASSAPFDPFSPNVIVVLRASGRAAALAALGAIDSLDNLRLLAREQRLSVGPEPCSAAELRAAIVTAAERRIANRLAAAG